MAYNNGLIYVDNNVTPPNGVSVHDVKTVLGVSSGDVATLCTSQNVNKWAKCKPVPMGKIAHAATVNGSRYSMTGSVSATDNPWYLGELSSLTTTTSGGLAPDTVTTTDNKNVTLYPIAGMWVPVMNWNGDISYVTNAIDDMNTSGTGLYQKAWTRVDWGVFDSTTHVNSYGLPSRLQDFDGYNHNARLENGAWCEGTVYSGQTIAILLSGSVSGAYGSIPVSEIGKAFANDFTVGVILKSDEASPDYVQVFSYEDGGTQTITLKDWDDDIYMRIEPSDMPSDYTGKTWKVYAVAKFTSGNNTYWMFLPVSTTYPNPRQFFVSGQSAYDPFASNGVEIQSFYHIPYPNWSGHWVEQSYNGVVNENLYVGIGDYGKYCIAIEYKNTSSGSVTIDMSGLSFYWQYCGALSSQYAGKGGKEDFDVYLLNSIGNTTRLTNLDVTWAANETKTLIFDFAQQNANGTKDDSSTSVFTDLSGTTYDMSLLEADAAQATYTGLFDLESAMLMYYTFNGVDNYLDVVTVHALYISQASGLRASKQDRILEEDGTIY